MPDALALTWRQYRLERRMFWRNPSAAFFNFVLPLLFLAGAGAALSGNQHQLEPARADDRGHERDVDHVHRACLQHRVPARARRAQAHPRHAAADDLLLRRRGRQRGDQHGAADRDHRARRAGILRDRMAAALGRADRVRARRRRLLRRPRCRLCARDPQLRVDRRVRQRRVPAGRGHLLLRVRLEQRSRLRAHDRRSAAPEAADRRAVRRDGRGHRPGQQSRRARGDRAVGRLRAVLRRARLLVGGRRAHEHRRGSPP